jgi:hypothetical protein
MNVSVCPFRQQAFNEYYTGDDLSGSFFLIPSGSEPGPVALRKENTELRNEIAAMQERLTATEQLLRLRKEQDTQLRNSIFEVCDEMATFFMHPQNSRRHGLDRLNGQSVPLGFYQDVFHQ